ncbi:MAG: hypothetical protein RR232_03060 [Clostridia bacterium]
MRKKLVYILIGSIIVAALAAVLLFLSSAPKSKLQGEIGTVTIEHISAEQLPKQEQSEDWFVGDWAGLVTGSGEPDRGWTDFGMAALGYYAEQTCLLRIYAAGQGYEAKFASSVWAVTEHTMDSITLLCTTASHEAAYAPDSIYYEQAQFEVGQTIALSYCAYIESSVESAQVPQEHILLGAASPGEFDQWNHNFILALLPTGEKRGDESGVYPCWYGGYENMESDFKDMFCLGVSSRGKRMLGEVLDRGDGVEIVVGVFDGMDYNRTFFYGERDMRGEDLTTYVGMEDADGALFPLFLRYDANSTSTKWVDVSKEHSVYYEAVYIPKMQSEIETLKASGDDNIWTRRQIAARRGFIDYAKNLIGGVYTGGGLERLIPFIPQLTLLDPLYREGISLANIKPGDAVEDAQKLYSLHPLREDEQALFGLEGLVPGKTLYYTDGEGLLITAYAQNGKELIGRVEIVKPGYHTPDGRQVGDPLDKSRQTLYGKDAKISFGEWYVVENDVIDRISMTITLDRIWDETALDVDGDGEPERITLSGRSYGSYVEQGTVLGDGDKGTLEDGDYGTKATLRIYKDDALYAETQLPLYIYYLLPQFCDKLQTRTSGEIYIVCETGGTGNEEPIYCVRVMGKAFTTEFMGFRNIYD